jgi:hypothetical protein
VTLYSDGNRLYYRGLHPVTRRHSHRRQQGRRSDSIVMVTGFIIGVCILLRGVRAIADSKVGPVTL